MKVFVDTGAWAALAISSDEHHFQARKVVEDLKSQVIQFITSDYVFDETITLIRFRASHAKAVEIGKSIIDSSVTRIVNVDQTIWDSAWKKFIRFKDKEWSFTDCTSFAIMDSLSIKKAFSFDKNFSQYGKELLGTRQ